MINIILLAIIVVFFSERLAKLIPDSKAGGVGSVRKLLKVVSLYTADVK